MNEMGPKIQKNTTDSLSTNPWTKAFGLSLVSIALTLALGSYNSSDPSLNTFSSSWKTPTNILGYFGSWTADLIYQLFGFSAWLIPSLIVAAVVRWSLQTQKSRNILNLKWWAGLIVATLASGLFLELSHAGAKLAEGFPSAGLVGIGLSALSQPLLGKTGSYLLSLSLAWSFCMIWWQELPEHVVRLTAYGLRYLARLCNNGSSLVLKRTKSIKIPSKNVIAEPAPLPTSTSSAPTIRIEGEDDTKPDPHQRDRARKTHSFSSPKQWALPPISLLEMPKQKIKSPTQDMLVKTASKITESLKSFEIEGEVVEICPGPIITMYEFQPGPGVRVQKIMSAATDLAMSLGVPSVRIVAPIPGKSVAGIEVPNMLREEIVLRDVFEATKKRAQSMKLPLVMGKDGAGNPIAEDLSRMPHLLVGGATNMGKSVLVNSILTSLLIRFTPDELRVIIVDPKLVEFKVFEDIPHLLLPIVNDPTDASQALKWAVAETKRRYLQMQKYSAKNLESYNEKIAQVTELKEGEVAPERFPYIVIIIDELAELMLTAKRDVEQSIVRLTQLARAAGLHLIMATQRPSADVVTGLIKSNCPSRAALRVASASDSRIILDCSGAEQLLGRGDMFFTSTGPMGLKRMQGAFVSDAEIEKITDFWRNQGEPEYKDEILAPETDPLEATENNQDRDALYGDVIEFAREKGKLSTSLIQRKFQIGYTRAARIMEQLELAGIVAESGVAGKARDVNL